MNFSNAIKILKESNLTLVESVSKNTVAKYRQRVLDHIKRVKYFYNVLVESGQIPLNDIDIERVMKHDADKLKYENLTRQALRYSPDTLTKEDKKKIDAVVMEHIKHNPHHAEYWGKGKYNDYGLNCKKMKDTYIYEMCADWAATAEEHGNSLKLWCDSVLNKKWYFTDEQIELITSICDYLEEYIDPALARNYGLESISLASMKS